jgi:hypothetical protein
MLLVFSVFSMNLFFLSKLPEITPFPFWDRKGKNFFLFSKIIFKNFHFLKNPENPPLTTLPVSFAGCKGSHYFLFSKLFSAHFKRKIAPISSTFLTSACCIIKYFLASHFRIYREKDLPLKVICKIARIAERWIRKLL